MSAEVSVCGSLSQGALYGKIIRLQLPSSAGSAAACWICWRVQGEPTSDRAIQIGPIPFQLPRHWSYRTLGSHTSRPSTASELLRRLPARARDKSGNYI